MSTGVGMALGVAIGASLWGTSRTKLIGSVITTAIYAVLAVATGSWWYGSIAAVWTVCTLIDRDRWLYERRPR